MKNFFDKAHILNQPKILYLVSIIFGQFHYVILLPILTDKLSLDEYSDYIIISQIIGFFQAFLALTYSGGLMKFWHENNKKEKLIYINTILVFLISASLTCVTIAYFLIDNFLFEIRLLYGLDKSILKLMLFIIVASVLKYFLLTFYRVSLQPTKHLIQSLLYFFSIIISILLILSKDKFSLYFVFQIFLCGELISLLYLLYYYIPLFRFYFRLNFLFDFYRFSWPLILGSLFTVLFQNIDRSLIKSFLDKSLLAEYGTALTLSLCSGLILKAIVSAAFPKLKEASTLDNRYELVQQTEKNNSLMLMFLSCLLLISINDILFRLFSNNYYNEYSALCLNLITASNFFRLKYLFNDNRLFIKNEPLKMLYLRIFILITGLVIFPLIMYLNFLIFYPLSLILIYFLIRLYN